MLNFMKIQDLLRSIYSKYFIFYNNCRIRTDDEMSPKQKENKYYESF